MARKNKKSDTFLSFLDAVGVAQDYTDDLDNALGEIYTDTYFDQSYGFLDTDKKTSKLASRIIEECIQAVEDVDYKLRDLVELAAPRS